MKKIAIAATAAALVACGETSEPPVAADSEVSVADRAQRIAQASIIVDTHIDVPYRLEEKWDDVSQATDGGDFDYPRAVQGGLNAPFMSIYTPAEFEAEGTSRETADRLIDMVEKIVADAPDKFAIARSPGDVRTQFASGLISLPLGMENGSPIEGDLNNLNYFFDRGIRYITLTHSLSNHISDSSYDENRQWQGLSEFGEQVVRRMNELGIIVDISHVSDEAFFDVLELSDAPVIASHSSLRHFTPGWERNMSDDMVRQLAEHGGLIMINFGSAFITEAAYAYGTARRAAFAAWRDEHGHEDSEALALEFNNLYAEEHGHYPFATTDQVLDHFDRVRDLVGIDYVGIGSDYDGVGDSLPIGLKDVASYPNLIAGLLGRGYSEADIDKILSGNLLRVWEQVEAAAVVQLN